MPIYRLTQDAILPLPETTFLQHGIRERSDLQRLLRASVSVVVPDVLIIAEEFAEWEGSKRRIDLLGVDHRANLVIIELKRDDDGGHMELQAIRYAAMVSKMTFAQAADVYQAFLDKAGRKEDARGLLLEFLKWDDPREDDFAPDVRIVLVSADFSRELTTAVLWLNEHDMAIECVRLKPYDSGQGVFIDVQTIIPLPEASDYQEKVRQKAVERREAARQAGENTGYWFMNTGDDASEDRRRWEDSKRYGFLQAGGGKRYIDAAKKLRVGDKVFAYLNRHGYVGLGEVTAEAVPFKDFIPEGLAVPLPNLDLVATVDPAILDDPERGDLCVAVQWVKAVGRDEAVLMNRALRGTLNRIKQLDLVEELLRFFAPPRPTD